MLEAGPAAGLGLAPSAATQSFQFTLARRGDAVSFELPGNVQYALRIRPRNPLTAAVLPPAPQPDLAIHARDLSFDSGTGTLGARVHNIGAVDLGNISVDVHDGSDASGTLLASQNLASLAAPLDLTPRFADLVFPGLGTSTALTVVLSASAGIEEVTLDNNQASIVVNGSGATPTPPMILAVDPPTATPGAVLTLTGANFETGMTVLDAGVPAPALGLTVLDAGSAELQIAGNQPAPATLLVSLGNAAGLESNVVPIAVNPLADAVFANGFEN